MDKARKQESSAWLRANAPEPDYKTRKGWRRVVWRVANFLDGWYGF